MTQAENAGLGPAATLQGEGERAREMLAPSRLEDGTCPKCTTPYVLFSLLEDCYSSSICVSICCGLNVSVPSRLQDVESQPSRQCYEKVELSVIKS